MSDNANWVLVDDRDPTIAYSVAPGAVIWHGGVSQEYDQTTTGLDAGDTLTYYFKASMIGVFGTYGPTDNSGPPVAVYQVDNAPATTVTAPVTQATLYRQGFWTSATLPPLAGGAFHKLVVTATAPNETLWVDYLAYPPTSGDTSSSPSPSSSSPASGPGTSAPTPGTGTFVPTSIALPITTAFGVTPSNTVGTQPASATSNTNTNISAIVAGVVVGAVALILAAVALACIRQRRLRPTAREYFIQGTLPSPTSSFPNNQTIIQGGNNTSPDMSHNYSTSLTQPITSNLSGSEDTSIPRPESLQEQLLRPLPSIPVRTIDGGVSVMGGPLEIPPEYQEHY